MFIQIKFLHLRRITKRVKSILLYTFFKDIGGLTYFSLRFFKELFGKSFEIREFLKQCFQIGNHSLLLVVITNFIIGLVLTLQTRPTLQDFGAESWMPSMVGISIVREIGPIITALICAGKIASGIGAELGSMRVTEQIDAMEVSGTNPFNFLVVTKVLATTIMLPILVVFGDTVALLGSFLVENLKDNVSFQLFFNKVFDALEFSDLLPATIKSIFFGFGIGIVGSYKGYYCEKGTVGVGKASNTAVVFASMFIFVIDFFVVFLTDALFNW